MNNDHLGHWLQSLHPSKWPSQMSHHLQQVNWVKVNYHTKTSHHLSWLYNIGSYQVSTIFLVSNHCFTFSYLTLTNDIEYTAIFKISSLLSLYLIFEFNLVTIHRVKEWYLYTVLSTLQHGQNKMLWLHIMTHVTKCYIMYCNWSCTAHYPIIIHEWRETQGKRSIIAV